MGERALPTESVRPRACSVGHVAAEPGDVDATTEPCSDSDAACRIRGGRLVEWSARFDPARRLLQRATTACSCPWGRARPVLVGCREQERATHAQPATCGGERVVAVDEKALNRPRIRVRPRKAQPAAFGSRLGRRAAKKAFSSRRQASSSTPAVTSKRWLSRASVPMPKRVCTAPALGSGQA